jgi:secreted PhoX family phosphatase
MRRYRITGAGRAFRRAEFDARFDARAHPHEPNRFGWVVEIDPYDPRAVPSSAPRSADWRERAGVRVGPDRRLAFYSGRRLELEYVYWFVTARPYDPADRAANRSLLDEGTLYAARFNADGTGDWLPLVHGHGPLTPAGGFADQGEVVIHARLAADALGATRMDRPEWIMPHPGRREVYCACTASAARGRDVNEGPNAVNPRAPNPFGHLVRWREDGGDVAATRFRWDVFVKAGPAERGGTTNGDGFACPDGLWVDSRGVLWVQVDVSPTSLGKGEFAPLGNNAMLAVDPATGVFKRFLTGPRGCEITGFHTTPDNRTAFVNIQHPGEVPGGDRSNPRRAARVSNWPDFARRPARLGDRRDPAPRRHRRRDAGNDARDRCGAGGHRPRGRDPAAPAARRTSQDLTPEENAWASWTARWR